MSTEEGTGTGNGASAPRERRKPGTFDSERARQAGQASAASRRAKKLAAQQSPSVDEEDVRTLVVPVRIGGIIRALEKDALGGSANAARELRAWLEQYPPRDGSVDAADLDRATRDKLLARLLAELADDTPAQS